MSDEPRLIPPHAEQRIRELAEGRTAFTSGLSVGDFALSRLGGIRPVCQVMGSSVYQVGWQSMPWGGWRTDATTTELRQISDAWNEARRLALARLAEEARLAGCHAVVDVTFERRSHPFLDDEVEVVVNGTAVHLPEGLESGDAPVLTDLSLPDYTLLRDAGYRPVGVVAATSVFYVIPSRSTRRATTGWGQWQNQELKDFTQGVYYAREVAVGRAASDAQTLGAGGMVGVVIDEDVATRETGSDNNRRIDLIVTFHVVGTAIAPLGEHRPLDPNLMIRLDERTP